MKVGFMDLEVEKHTSYSPSGVVYERMPTATWQWASAKQQRLAVGKMVELLGPRCFSVFDGTNTKTINMKAIIKEVNNSIGQNYKYHTLRKWFIHTMKFGVVPRDGHKIGKFRKPTTASKMKQRHLTKLKQIVDRRPYLYLDEIQRVLCKKTDMEFKTQTIWDALTKRLGYSLKVLNYKAKEHDRLEKELFKTRLASVLSHPSMLIIVDESHRGRNEGRRNRAWALPGMQPEEEAWFARDGVRYTLLAAANWNGFVKQACQVVHREKNKSDDDPTRGTVDTKRFEEYVEFYLLPTLGNYARQEPNSIVLMDNVIMHLSEKVQKMIAEKGALLIFTAPFSPELNPIELMFSTYKAMLKRHYGLDWYAAHYAALEAVTPDKARNDYFHCDIPGAAIFRTNDDVKLDLDGPAFMVGVGTVAGWV